MNDFLQKTLLCAAAGLMAACSPSPSDDTAAETETTQPALEPGANGTLRIYSARHYDSDRIMYEAFEKQTGVRVLYREAGANQLLETMKAEG